jgi:hypothetical protein
MVANLRDFSHRFTKRERMAVKKQGERILKRAQDLIPVDNGDAKNSGRVTVSTKGYSVSITFGDAKTQAYILALHEHLSSHSPYSWRVAEASGRRVVFHPSGTGPKFLERALMEAVRTLARDFAMDLRLDSI